MEYHVDVLERLGNRFRFTNVRDERNNRLDFGMICFLDTQN